MRKPQGYAVISSPEACEVDFDQRGRVPIGAGTYETDTLSCGHCGTIVHVGPKQKVDDIGGFCRQCMKAICVKCLDTGRCDPLEKKLERAEARDRALRTYGW